MIFSGANLDRVLAGTKTQTRRPVRTTADREWNRTDLPCSYRVGTLYGVQPGRTKRAVARIRVLSVEKVPVEGISEADAIAEGFESAAAFEAWWLDRYQTLHGDCWRIEFELVRPASSVPSVS